MKWANVYPTAERIKQKVNRRENINNKKDIKMKKKMLSAAFAVVIMAVAGYMYIDQTRRDKTDMILANIEALASNGEFDLQWYPQRNTENLSSNAIVDSFGITLITVQKVTCPLLSLKKETCIAGIDTLRIYMPRY